MSTYDYSSVTDANDRRKLAETRALNEGLALIPSLQGADKHTMLDAVLAEAANGRAPFFAAQRAQGGHWLSDPSYGWDGSSDLTTALTAATSANDGAIFIPKGSSVLVAVYEATTDDWRLLSFGGTTLTAATAGQRILRVGAVGDSHHYRRALISGLRFANSPYGANPDFATGIELRASLAGAAAFNHFTSMPAMISVLYTEAGTVDSDAEARNSEDNLVLGNTARNHKYLGVQALWAQRTRIIGNAVQGDPTAGSHAFRVAGEPDGGNNLLANQGTVLAGNTAKGMETGLSVQTGTKATAIAAHTTRGAETTGLQYYSTSMNALAAAVAYECGARGLDADAVTHSMLDAIVGEMDGLAVRVTEDAGASKYNMVRAIIKGVTGDAADRHARIFGDGHSLDIVLGDDSSGSLHGVYVSANNCTGKIVAKVLDGTSCTVAGTGNTLQVNARNVTVAGARNVLTIHATSNVTISGSNCVIVGTIEGNLTVSGSDNVVVARVDGTITDSGSRNDLRVPRRGVSSNVTLISSANSPYTALATDSYVRCNAASGAITVNLPPAADCPGRTYTFKKTESGANAVTIDGNSTETIDGSTTYVLAGGSRGSVTIRSTGTNWDITT